MDIQAEKIQLAKLLLATDNPEILKSIKMIFKKDKSDDFWNELSLEQQNEIDTALLEIKNGEVSDYDLFMQNHR